MQYGWHAHHIFNEMAKGHLTVKDFDDYMVKIDSVFQDDDINMNFVTNHDENSWNGTLKERMPNNKEIFTALTYTMPGMPLIYSGQEYDLNHRLKFFEKDSIPKTKGNYFQLLKKLGELKDSNPALNGGKDAASYERVQTNNDHILMFKRQKDGSAITFIGNFSGQEQTLENKLQGTPLDFIADKPLQLDGKSIILKPWEYKILID
jgi:1,4-alpha-glucan branching enzyme